MIINGLMVVSGGKFATLVKINDNGKQIEIKSYNDSLQ